MRHNLLASALLTALLVVHPAVRAADDYTGASADRRLADSFTMSFREDFAAVIDEAKDYLAALRPAFPAANRKAVVLDLDETVMDNRAYFIIHKTYDPELWDQWVNRMEAPPIPEALDFFHWLKKHRFKVYFVSGRREHQREETVENLARMGITGYDGLYLKPDDYGHDSATNFKVAAQKEIEAAGHDVVLILGDQYSDLRNGLGKGFKLPNPIYNIP